jgi:CRP-like cAMP-binding protein
MDHILVQMMEQLTPLTEDEKFAIIESFPIKTYAKGTFLLKEGRVAHDAYYVLEGLIREYELFEGEEKTTALYTEGQAAANFHSIASGTPSKRYFLCEEKTTVAVVNSEKEHALYKKYPRFEKYCRVGMEEMMGAELQQITDFVSMKPEERYLNFINERPGLINRLPQYHIASYLGIKPETLSRIRRRIVSKKN